MRSFLQVAAAAGLVAGCMGCDLEVGLGGPAWLRPSAADGPCHAVSLGSSLDSGSELLALFACLNSAGAFAPLEPLVQHLAASEPFWSVLHRRAGTLLDLDAVGVLEASARLLEEPDSAASQLSHLYVEAYEGGLLPPTVALVQQASAAMLACETSERRAQCSVPGLTERLLAAGTVRQAWELGGRLWAGIDAPQRRALTEALADMLVRTSTLHVDARGEQSNAGNPLLDWLLFLVSDAAPGGDNVAASPLARLLPHAQALIGRAPAVVDRTSALSSPPAGGRAGQMLRGDLVRSVARHLARPWRQGALAHLPAQLETLLTRNARGEQVGLDGTCIVDEILSALQRLGGLDGLARHTVAHDDYGEPVSFLQLALDTADNLYLSGASVSDITAAVDGLRELMCSGEGTGELCRLMDALVPPSQAAVATGIGDVVLPVIYVAHQMVDEDLLVEFLELLLQLDIVGRTRAIAVLSTEVGLVGQGIALFPVLVDPELGTLTPIGEQSLELAQRLLGPWNDDDLGEVTPVLVAAELARSLLRPDNPGADLDWLLGTLGKLWRRTQSAFSPERLGGLLSALRQGLALERGAAWEELHELLARPDLVTSVLQLGADQQLADRLAPRHGRRDAPWYLYDLIDSGLLRRILAYVATMLRALDGQEVIDP